MIFFIFLLLLLLHGEETIEFGVDHIGDLFQVIGVVAKLASVTIDDNQLAFIRGHPVLIAFLETLQIIKTHRLFVFAASLLNLCH